MVHLTPARYRDTLHNYMAFFHILHHRRRQLGCLFGLLLLLGLIALGIKGWRLYSIAQELYTDGRTARAYATSWSDPATLAALGPLLERMHATSIQLHDEAAPFLPLTRRLGRVPVYGADLAASEALLDLAVSLTAAADATLDALAPTISGNEPGTSLQVALMRDLVAPPAQLATARQAIDQALLAWEHIPVDDLSPALRKQMQPLERYLPLAHDALHLGAVLPDMLGANRPREYLFLAQNPDELRATGGMIGAAGILRLQGGRVADFSLRNAGAINNFAASPYPDPPDPLRRYMHIELWAFQDANWSPDFPTTALAAMDLYRRGQGRDVDGVIAVNPQTIELLLEVIGPVQVAGIPEAITAENLSQYLRSQYNLERTDAGLSSQPKTYLAYLAEAVIAKLDTQMEHINLPALALAFQQALDERQLLIYTQEPDIAAFLAGRGWDGSVQPGVADFLMVVDANMGYNKANANIEQSVDYLVDLSDPATPVATLTITHTHTLDRSKACRQWDKQLNTSNIYEALMNDCYWNFLRVLVPHGSRPEVIHTNPTPGEWMSTGIAQRGTLSVTQGPAHTYEFGTFLVVPTGESRTTMVRYRLPATVIVQEGAMRRYRLHIQKQPGREAMPFMVRLRVPPHTSRIQATPLPSSHDHSNISFDLSLIRDQTVDIVFVAPD